MIVKINVWGQPIEITADSTVINDLCMMARDASDHREELADYQTADAYIGYYHALNAELNPDDYKN